MGGEQEHLFREQRGVVPGSVVDVDDLYGLVVDVYGDGQYVG